VSVDFVKAIKGAYPIGTTSYALAYASGKDAEKQKVVAEFLTYMLDKCPTKYPREGLCSNHWLSLHKGKGTNSQNKVINLSKTTPAHPRVRGFLHIHVVS